MTRGRHLGRHPLASPSEPRLHPRRMLESERSQWNAPLPCKAPNTLTTLPRPNLFWIYSGLANQNGENTKWLYTQRQAHSTATQLPQNHSPTTSGATYSWTPPPRKLAEDCAALFTASCQLADTAAGERPTIGIGVTLTSSAAPRSEFTLRPVCRVYPKIADRIIALISRVARATCHETSLSSH